MWDVPNCKYFGMRRNLTAHFVRNHPGIDAFEKESPDLQMFLNNRYFLSLPLHCGPGKRKELLKFSRLQYINLSRNKKVRYLREFEEKLYKVELKGLFYYNI